VNSQLGTHILAITPGQGFDAPKWRRVLLSGVDAFMLREKNLSARALLDATRWCQDTAPGLELWVNGRLDVALTANCGLHAPEAYPDVDSKVVRLSKPLHEESQWCARHHQAQLLISPLFESPGKQNKWGSTRLKSFLRQMPQERPRMLALGGINPRNAAELSHPNLDGVAVIRALWDDPDPSRCVEKLRAALCPGQGRL
jgi:thiamine monophosphate synthase